MIKYTKAPLPFQGQKRNWMRFLPDILSRFDEDSVFVDLFGGSGLLSHNIKYNKPNSTVIYNDFDYYVNRLTLIPYTNKLIEILRSIITAPHGTRISEEEKELIIYVIRSYPQVDYDTIGTILLFSGRGCRGLEDLVNEKLWSKIPKKNYSSEGYLDGVRITHHDYKMLLNLYSGHPNVVFVADPPYTNTDMKRYHGDSFSKGDLAELCFSLAKENFIFFTSEKSHNYQWLDFCEKIQFRSGVNYNASYIDVCFINKKTLTK